MKQIIFGKSGLIHRIGCCQTPKLALFCLLILGMSWLKPVRAQLMDLPASNSDVNIQASFYKNSFEIGEPLVVQLAIRNLSDKPLTFMSSVSFHGDLTCVIKRPRRLPHEFLGVEQSGVSPDISAYLKPGDARFYNLPIIFDRESEGGFLFTEPQTVTVAFQLRYAINGGIKDKTWKSEPLMVEIVAPSEASRAAHEILNKHRVAMALQTFSLNDETLVDFRKALDVTPRESAMHPWLLAALARMYGFSRRQDADVMIGLDYANQLVTLHPTSHLADDALMLQAFIQDNMGLEDQARQTLVQLYNTYFTSEYITEGNPLFVKYFNFNPNADPAMISTDFLWMLRL